MPLRIRIKNLVKKRKINNPLIKKKALHVLRSFGKKNALVDITFISDRKIKVLNKKYMKRQCPTDVLSFPLKDCLPEKSGLIGDIYISSDMAYRNARRFNTGFQKELLLYTVHGVLHLLGFKDRTAKEKNKIRKLENKFL